MHHFVYSEIADTHRPKGNERHEIPVMMYASSYYIIQALSWCLKPLLPTSKTRSLLSASPTHSAFLLHAERVASMLKCLLLGRPCRYHKSSIPHYYFYKNIKYMIHNESWYIMNIKIATTKKSNMIISIF